MAGVQSGAEVPSISRPGSQSWGQKRRRGWGGWQLTRWGLELRGLGAPRHGNAVPTLAPSVGHSSASSHGGRLPPQPSPPVNIHTHQYKKHLPLLNKAEVEDRRWKRPGTPPPNYNIQMYQHRQD